MGMQTTAIPADSATNLACPNHPDRPARLFCQKLERRFCEECAACPRPTHCKFRTQCVIAALPSATE
jgi:hypothetical protein